MTLALMTPGQIERGEATAAGAPSSDSEAPYQRWQHGPPADPAFFPIGVWLQDPRNAEAYKRAGINLYVALWQGPTEPQLATLKAAGMPVICGQTRIGLAHVGGLAGAGSRVAGPHLLRSPVQAPVQRTRAAR